MGLFSDEDTNDGGSGSPDMLMMLLLFSLLPSLMKGFQPSTPPTPIYNIYIQRNEDEDGNSDPTTMNETPYSHQVPVYDSYYEMGHFPGGGSGGADPSYYRYIYPIGGGGDNSITIGIE
jgi:hypothetical protein